MSNHYSPEQIHAFVREFTLVHRKDNGLAALYGATARSIVDVRTDAVVPRLLRTNNYVTSLLRTGWRGLRYNNAGSKGIRHEVALEENLRRWLLERQDEPALTVVMGESALRSTVHYPGLVDHIAALANRRIDVHVMPADAPITKLHSYPFSVYAGAAGQRGGMVDAVVFDDARDIDMSTAPDTAAAHLETVEAALATRQLLSKEASLALIQQEVQAQTR